jgi:hypothetical protein
MARKIDRTVNQLSVQLAYQSGRPLAELRPIIRGLFDQALREYLAAGAPYGQSDEAFLEWLEERQAVAKTA